MKTSKSQHTSTIRTENNETVATHRHSGHIGHILCTFTHILTNSQSKNKEKSKEWEKISYIIQAHQTTGPWELNQEKAFHKKGGMKENNGEKVVIVV